MLIRHAGGSWKQPEDQAYENQEALEVLLAGSMNLVPAPPGEEWLVAARQVPVRVGFIDLVLVGRNGSIAVVECKLAANAEAKRKVVGQALSYAACLWQME